MVAAEFSGAEWIGSPHYWNGRNGQRAAWIIVHGTAGGSSAQEVAGWFQSNNPPTSTHYVIGRDGTIVQCVREENSAWGNGVLSDGHDAWWNENINPNLQTISIEHVKTDPNNASQLTAEQEASSFALIAYLCAKWQIPARPANASGGITGHYSIDPVNRANCPGNYPWQALWEYLGSAGSSGPFTTLAMNVSSVSKAPLGTGFLGIIERIDEYEQIPAFDASIITSWEPTVLIPFAFGVAEAVTVRLMVMAVGLALILIVVFNAMKPIVEAQSQVAGQLIGAAASGAL